MKLLRAEEPPEEATTAVPLVAVGMLTVSTSPSEPMKRRTVVPELRYM